MLEPKAIRQEDSPHRASIIGRAPVYRRDSDNFAVSQIASIPLAWQAVLKGVYLLVCKETGKQYVGSAKGEDSLWGRFLTYAAKATAVT